MPDLLPAAGDVLELELGRMVPGGSCLARAGATTVFVRLGLPGERVRARVTRASARAVLADVVEVLDPSPGRVTPPCPVAGRCGGCDMQHAARASQLALKAGIVADALRRQGGLDDDAITGLGIRVESLDEDGLGWRASARWHRAADGRPGFLAWHAHEVVPVETCPVLVPALDAAMQHRDVLSARASSDGTVPEDGRRSRQVVRHRAWAIAPATFWQGHAAAAPTLVDAVLDAGAPRAGEAWADLYAGAGLFSAFLAEAVGPSGSVQCVESDASAVRDARRALHDLPQAAIVEADAGAWTPDGALDGIVLDPPRTGADARLLAAMAAATPSRIVYVACDPVTFARDARILGTLGYRLAVLRAFDCFPMTHHVETVATLLPGPASGKVS